uniref:Endonuclease/exonuclease/phosphatase domain-containing protein n=1 Tax=Scylla olivacea TaxID=85551 RepID=A0A0P4W031_SCYOL
MQRLKIIQHNVLHWTTRKYDLCNTYRQFDPDVILINGHGLPDENRLRIPGFRVHQMNSSGEQNDGVAIAVRCSLTHRIQDDFLSDTLAVDIETFDGTLTIATTYLPPRRQYIPHPDFMRLIRRQTPMLFAGDLNARHQTLGYGTTNQVGRDLTDYFRRQTARHIGPNFPTYYGPLSSTSPDIVFSNQTFHYAHSLSPGPLTSSDHIPIIIDISTFPILTPTPLSYSFHRVDWDSFQEDESLDMTDATDISRASLEEIDTSLADWMTKVKDTADRHIPKTQYRLEPAPRPTRQTQMTRIQFNALRQRAQLHGWTNDDYRRYVRLRLTLHELRRDEARRHWGQTLEGLASRCKEPRRFWAQVKRLSGRTKGQDSYLLDRNGQRHYSNADKARLFTRKWETVFQDDDEDYEDNDMVLDYLAVHRHRTTPHQEADPTRLAGDSPLTCFISLEELKAAIRSSKPTCPGSSGINRTILAHLPPPALARLQDIFNSALSAGYFPDGLKEGDTCTTRHNMVSVGEEARRTP